MSNTKEDVNERKSNSESSSGLGNEHHEPRKAIDAMNWSLGMKIYHTAIPCFLAFLMYVLEQLRAC
jgi:hypothetical protein